MGNYFCFIDRFVSNRTLSNENILHDEMKPFQKEVGEVMIKGEFYLEHHGL